ncbi:ABC transporter substrate-binding protein, partial [Chloroflexota bacterium]
APGEPATPGEPAAPKTVTVGFLAALTGEVAGWGLPGLYGCEIWVDEVNEAGGLQIGDDKYLIEIAAYDDEYMSSKCVVGAKKLVLEDDVKIIVTLCAPPTRAIQPFTTEHKIITTTLMPSDITPDYPYLIAPCEISPFHHVVAWDYIGRTYPEAKTVAICNPEDESRYYHMAIGLAAFEGAGLEVVYDKFYDGATTDFAPIMTAMLATDPDILCFDAAYSYHTHLLTEQAMLQGFEGTLCSGSLDMYPELIERVGKEYVEGYTFVFPDFDDPMLLPEQNAFFDKYNELYPGTWSAVSYEYADILKVWARGAERAGSIDPMTVLEAMKADPNPVTTYGPAQWAGEEVIGLNNALIGYWPVVQIQDGKARIVEMASALDVYNRDYEATIKYFEEFGLMWYQQ